MAFIRPIGPGSTQGEGLDALLDEMRSAILELQTPQGPVQLASVTQANLPPAADWNECAIYVSDIDKVAVSNGTSWLNADGGAL